MAATPRKKVPSRQNQKQRPSGKGSTTFLFMLLFILAITVFILAFKDPIARFMSGNSASKGSASTTVTSVDKPTNPKNTGKSIVVDGGEKKEPPVSTTSTTNPRSKTTTVTTLKVKNSSGQLSTPTTTVQLNTNPGNKEDLKNVNLWFSKVDDNGHILMQKTERAIRFNESPLGASIKALLKGPNGPEISSGLVTMIPSGTSLLSVWVRDQIAYLNFSESFQFNPLGADGLRAQVQQVVWVATEFATVKAVQILIDGKNVNYLGGDNVEVGKPLKRADLP